ncbi:alpha/beta hydrolase [Priestia endophytica]|nr:alpha/beta hydrolase [Priestia endophytica]
MPSVLIITAEKDSLAKEADLYAEKLQKAGIEVTYKQYKAVHGFIHSRSLEKAESAWHFIRDTLKNKKYTLF